MVLKIGQLDVWLEHRELHLNGKKVQVGSRAFDILSLLIAADGALVSKDNIMQSVWPSTIVEENNLQVHVSALRRAFGPERHRITTEPGRGYRLNLTARFEANPAADFSHDAHDTDTDVDANANANAKAASHAEAVLSARHPLPARVPELIGREDTLSGIVAALHASGIVTLVGTGGIGKTRLAVEVAHTLQHAFADGVVFASFAAVYDAQSALDALALAMGSKLSTGRVALDQIAAHWRNREALVVLDNCEQVLEIAAVISEALVNASSVIRVLATSREALRVRDETVYLVPPLAVPTQEDQSSDVLRAPAVQFFLSRARASGVNFSLDERSVHLTGEICRRLDGIPLALELAASRAAVLGIGLLAENLDDRFRILAGGRRTALPRHQTLKATLDWSYRLLNQDERKLLRWFGTFVGGFTLEAACAMAEGAGLDRMQTLDAVSGLVSRSLLTTDLEGASYRYRLLETTRAYALQQLEDYGERAPAETAHATLCLELIHAAQKKWAERPVAEWHPEFTRELGNVRTALDWSFGGRGELAVGIELAAATVPFLYDLALVEECRNRARAALRALEQDKAGAADVDLETRLRLVSALASALVYTDGPLAETRDLWAYVLEEAGRAGYVKHELRALWGLWNWHQYGGRIRDALMFASRFSELARKTFDATHMMLGTRIEGIALHYAGDQPGARGNLERMIAEYEKPVRRWGMIGLRVDHGIVARATLARVMWVQGHHEDAADLAAHSYHAAERYDQEMVTCYVLVEAYVPIALLNGDYASAEQGLATLRELSSCFGFTIWSAACACYDAWLATVVEPGPDSIEKLHAAIEALRATGFLAPLSVLLCRLSVALMDEDCHDEALRTIDQAVNHCDLTGERWYYAELCRIKGEALRALNRPEEAQRWFVAALDYAQSHGAAHLELRAVTSASRPPLNVTSVQLQA